MDIARIMREPFEGIFTRGLTGGIWYFCGHTADARKSMCEFAQSPEGAAFCEGSAMGILTAYDETEAEMVLCALDHFHKQRMQREKNPRSFTHNVSVPCSQCGSITAIKIEILPGNRSHAPAGEA